MSQPIRRQHREDVDIVVDTEALTDELLLSIKTSTLAEYLTLQLEDATQSEDMFGPKPSVSKLLLLDLHILTCDKWKDLCYWRGA